MSTGVSKFFREQWLDGAFDLIKPPDLTLDGLLAKARAGHMTSGYRTGVWLVEVPSLGWKTQIVTLKGGERLSLGFRPRVEGEVPRKTQAKVEVPSRDALPDAGSVWAVLYHRDVLLEDEVVLEPETLQLVTVLANPDWRQVPMNPETLLANHYKFDGGTSTQMSAEEFEKKLYESLRYWRDKALAYVPGPKCDCLYEACTCEVKQRDPLTGWGIDTSTGTDILVYNRCSVIEDEQAHLVLSALRRVR